MASPKESGREAPLSLTPETLERLADFCNEAGMLRHTPRSGYAFLGSGRESVAEHSYRTTVLGYMLARMAGLDPSRVVMLCLFHDLHEARTGDFNYVNHRYDTCRARARCWRPPARPSSRGYRRRGPCPGWRPRGRPARGRCRSGGSHS